jgi:hypothetical protein
MLNGIEVRVGVAVPQSSDAHLECCGTELLLIAFSYTIAQEVP